MIHRDSGRYAATWGMSHEEFLQDLKQKGEYCGSCDASDCIHCNGGTKEYERPGQDLIHRPAYPTFEFESEEEKAEEEGELTYEDGTPYDPGAAPARETYIPNRTRRSRPQGQRNARR